MTSSPSLAAFEATDRFGGTTAYSGGAPWIPCNHVMKRLGLDFTIADPKSRLFDRLEANFAEEL